MEDELTNVLLLMKIRADEHSNESAPPVVAVEFTTQLLNTLKVPNILWHAPPTSDIERYI